AAKGAGQAEQHAIGPGLGFQLARAADLAAPAVGDRAAVGQVGLGPEEILHLPVDRIVGCSGVGIELIGVKLGGAGVDAGGDLLGFELALGGDLGAHEFGVELVAVTQLEGGAADALHRLHRLLDGARAAIVPRAAVAGAGAGPDLVAVVAHHVAAVL